MICGRSVGVDEKVCSKCLKGYWLGEDPPLQEGCRYCNNTKVYVLGGRTYQCEFCN
jgi:hypothetical protein